MMHMDMNMNIVWKYASTSSHMVTTDTYSPVEWYTPGIRNEHTEGANFLARKQGHRYAGYKIKYILEATLYIGTLLCFRLILRTRIYAYVSMFRYVCICMCIYYIRA